MLCLKIYYQNTYVLSIFHVKYFLGLKFVVFANNKIKIHNSSSTKAYAITLYRHFSHRDKNSVMAPKNLNTLMFTNLISNIERFYIQNGNKEI